MRNYLRYLIFVVPIILLTGCQDKIEETYKVLAPEYLTYDDLRNSFGVKSAEDIIQPGKLYFKDDYIFVNEYLQGIHIIDNSDPSSPEIIRFLEIPGNVDLAIKGTILYADSYVDLLAIDISDFNDIREVKRLENVFPYTIPEPGEGILDEVQQNEGVVTGWKEVDKTVEIENVAPDYPYYYSYAESSLMNDAAIRGGTGLNSGSGFGIGGSMARFTLYDEYLYAIDYSMLKLFHVLDAANPSYVKEIQIGWDIETLFPYNGKLFIGSMTGMYIYGLSDPLNPNHISTFAHVRSCDPVVVEGDYAYVTLRAGNLCGESQNLLDVIDISNINNPHLLKEYPMVEPFGLGIDDSVLFVCDGSAGLKIYNASDPMRISSNMLKHYEEINSFDVIPLGDVLLMIGSEGLYQYEYSDLSSINQLSFIPVYHGNE